MYDSHNSFIRNKLSDIPDKCLMRQHSSHHKNTEMSSSCEHFLQGKGLEESFTILPGLTLTFQDYLADHITCLHESRPDLLEINYCRYGRVGWNMSNGSSIYLGSGDFCLHTQTLCAGSEMTLPGKHFEGLSICIDTSIFDSNLPELLNDTGITSGILADKFCSHETFTTLAGNERTEPIFTCLFDLEKPFQRPYFFLKTMELLLYLGNFQFLSNIRRQGYPSEQVEVIREIHEYLLQHMDQRITIDDLSRRYLINPTTLKTVFKAVYGDSLASHMKEHRMERAAVLLTQTDQSISQVAHAVGYESSSRFSAAFREIYQILPLEYRKNH